MLVRAREGRGIRHPCQVPPPSSPVFLTSLICPGAICRRDPNFLAVRSRAHVCRMSRSVARRRPHFEILCSRIALRAALPHSSIRKPCAIVKLRKHNDSVVHELSRTSRPLAPAGRMVDKRLSDPGHVADMTDPLYVLHVTSDNCGRRIRKAALSGRVRPPPDSACACIVAVSWLVRCPKYKYMATREQERADLLFWGSQNTNSACFAFA